MFALIEDLDSIEKINWTPVILEKVHNSISEIKVKKEVMSLVEKKEVKEGKRASRKVRHANFFTPLLEDWFYFKTSEDKSSMDAAIAPYIYYVGRGMSTEEARSLVANAKLEASDRSELKFDCNVVDNVVNTLAEDYAGKILEHCVQQKIGLARSLRIEMSEEAIIRDLREKYCNSEASNWAFLKALVSSSLDRHNNRGDEGSSFNYALSPPRRSDSPMKEVKKNLEQKQEDDDLENPTDLKNSDDTNNDVPLPNLG
ncbi:hypothetical protein ACET3Z_028179 [Daucus carota]